MVTICRINGFVVKWLLLLALCFIVVPAYAEGETGFHCSLTYGGTRQYLSQQFLSNTRPFYIASERQGDRIDDYIICYDGSGEKSQTKYYLTFSNINPVIGSMYVNTWGFKASVFGAQELKDYHDAGFTYVAMALTSTHSAYMRQPFISNTVSYENTVQELETDVRYPINVGYFPVRGDGGTYDNTGAIVVSDVFHITATPRPGGLASNSVTLLMRTMKATFIFAGMCRFSISNTTVKLPAITSVSLPHINDISEKTAIPLSISCDEDVAPNTFSLDGELNSVQDPYTLQNDAGSSVSGVALRLFRDGKLVPLNQNQTLVGSSGFEPLNLSAAYIRTSEQVIPGQLLSHVTLTVHY